MSTAISAGRAEPVITSLAGEDVGDLRHRVEQLHRAVTSSSDDEPLLSTPILDTATVPKLRVAVIASTKEELATELTTVAAWLGEPMRPLRAASHAFLGRTDAANRIGVMFPGQGSPVYPDAGALGSCVPEAARVHAAAELDISETGAIPATGVQLAIVASSLAALSAIESYGIRPVFALGHSLGELTALYWAGALDRATLFRLARIRGRAMVEETSVRGAMASIIADAESFYDLVEGADVVLACENSPTQRVVSGDVGAIDELLTRARSSQARAVRLRVTGAFHSPLMKEAIPAFERAVATARVRAPEHPVISTVTGTWLATDVDVRGLLVDQIMSPVRFLDAIRLATGSADLMIEAGPGHVLSSLLAESSNLPTVAVEAGAPSGFGAMRLAAMAWVCGIAPLPNLPSKDNDVRDA